MRFVKTVAVGLSLLGLALTPAMAERGGDSERKSKNGLLEATVNGVDVVIEYGRPKVNGRTIWGDLVPFDKVWRTGADEATTIEIATDASIGGETLPAGKYALFTVPGEEKWEVVFNQVADQWGASKYDSAKDALRIEVKPGPAEMTEEMTFAATAEGVALRWEKIEVPISIAALK